MRALRAYSYFLKYSAACLTGREQGSAPHTWPVRATKSHQWEKKVRSVRSGVHEASLERNAVASTLLVQLTVDKATHFKRHNKRVF